MTIDGAQEATARSETASLPVDVITVELPAHSAYLSVLRTMTAGLAARTDFTVDEIEDLKMAIDEACAAVLPDAVADAQMTCDFELSATGMRVAVSTTTNGGEVPAHDSFAWMVLSALTDSVQATSDDSLVSVVLRKRRGESTST